MEVRSWFPRCIFHNCLSVKDHLFPNKWVLLKGTYGSEVDISLQGHELDHDVTYATASQFEIYSSTNNTTQLKI